MVFTSSPLRLPELVLAQFGHGNLSCLFTCRFEVVLVPRCHTIDLIDTGSLDESQDLSVIQTNLVSAVTVIRKSEAASQSQKFLRQSALIHGHAYKQTHLADFGFWIGFSHAFTESR